MVVGVVKEIVLECNNDKYVLLTVVATDNVGVGVVDACEKDTVMVVVLVEVVGV